MGNLVFQATLGGQVNLVGPNTASTFNLNVPAVAGTLVTTGDTGTVTNTMLATSAYTAPGTIGSGTANTGAFTTLSASSTVSGTGFSTYLASPPAIGGTAAAAGTFTTLTGSTSVTTPIVKSASSLTFQTNGTTTAVTIDASQNVGIGTTSPSTPLYVQNTSAGAIATQLSLRNNSNTDGTGVRLSFIGESTDAPTGYISNVRDGAGAYSLRFSTYGGGATTERMRIDSSGNLLVGTTSSSTFAVSNGVISTSGRVLATSSNVSPLALCRLTNYGSVADFYNYGASYVGSISVSASATAYNTSSDYRLKEDIAPMTGALAKVAQLKPVTYKWKVDGAEGEGFIAHELAEVCPHAVSGEKDAVDADGNPKYQGIDTSFLVATLTAALQETKALIDTQAETINALTARIVALEAK